MADNQTQRFWEGFEKRTGLKKGDKIMIGNVDSFNTEYTSLEELFDLFKVDPDVIPFQNDPNPQISNYNNDYAALYGQHPSFKLFTFGLDANGDQIEIEWQTVPVRKRINGLLETITFDLGGPETGFITIKK